MEHKATYHEKPMKAWPYLNLVTYEPDPSDIDRILGTEDTMRQQKESWLKPYGEFKGFNKNT